MWRKKTKKRTKDMKQICVPKCCQQRRSAGPKPRTDFSLFSSSSSSSSSSSYCPSLSSILRRRRGSRLEFSSCTDNLSITTAACMEKGCESFISMHKEVVEFPLVQCSISQNGGKGEVFSNSTRIPLTEIDFDQTTVLDASSDRNNEVCKNVANLNKSTLQVTGLNDFWMSPGIIVWGKTASQMWWPAKIMEEQCIPASTYDNNISRHILVQYYGNKERAWLDPARDVSQFDECFEERSCNPMEAFQDALREALDSKEQLSSCKQLDIEASVQKLHEQPSDAPSDKWVESSSSRTRDESIERGRGKRKRKPKVHFDEVTFPVKSAKKVRRFRIMRYLGLTPPVGSPFSLTSLNRNCQ